MAHEIDQEPQGKRDVPEPNAVPKTDSIHSSQAKRSVVKPEDYPADFRHEQAEIIGSIKKD